VNFIAAYATHPLVASTLRGWVKPEFIQLSLLANPNVPLNFNALENRYRYVDGASAKLAHGLGVEIADLFKG
jgi:hypothetical protein